MKLISVIFAGLLLTSYICQQSISGQFTTVCNNTVISNENDTGGICYEESLTTDARDWNGANLSCSDTNRRLANALNEEMNNEIERVTEGIDEYWIGLSRQNSSSGFFWSDGSSLSYTRWSSGHPTDGLNCVSVRGNDTEWYSRNCSDNIPYVCEREVCVDWIVRNGICYKAFNDTMTDEEAVTLCGMNNAYLAEIPNIYVDNIIFEIVRDLGGIEGWWIGLRTNDTHYYWRIGDFPLGNETPIGGDFCSTVHRQDSVGRRWLLYPCNHNQRAFCMIGPLTNEFPIERCENSSADTLMYEDSCYTLITTDMINLDRATLNCTDYYNGTLYGLDNATVNVAIRNEFGDGSDLSVVDPTEYSLFTPQDGYFNLFTSFQAMNYPFIPDCVGIESDGMISGSSCPGMSQTNYICKRGFLTTFAVTTVITIVENGTVNCSDPVQSNTSFCDIIEEIPTYQSENPIAVSILEEVDEYLRVLVPLINITTGIRLRIIQPGNVLVILGLGQNSTTPVLVGENVVTTNPNSFSNDTVLVVLSTTLNDTKELTNDTLRIVSDIIIIQASNELNGNLTIRFIIRNELKMDIPEGAALYCAFLDNDGTWSRSGITTSIGINDTVDCITEHLTPFALLSATSICDIDVRPIHTAVLRACSYTLLSVSLLFLLASIVSFLISWKKVFHVDVNVMNFNHSIALFLAIFVSIFGTELFSSHRIVCHGVTFLWHLFWTNAFLSSLSISILVFYSIWIVGVHPAKKLSPFLLPISWSISLVWTLIWLAYGIVHINYINERRHNSQCKESCTLSTQSSLVYALIVPVIVILSINLFILSLNLLKIRQVFKNKDRDEKELIRLRRVAFGGLLLVPSLGLPFLLSIPLSFSPLYKDNIPLYLFFTWTSLISTATIGILHFLLVTYQTPEVNLPRCIRSKLRNQQIHTTDTSLPSTLPISYNTPAPLRLNVVKHKVNDCVIMNEYTDSESVV